MQSEVAVAGLRARIANEGFGFLSSADRRACA